MLKISLIFKKQALRANNSNILRVKNAKFPGYFHVFLYEHKHKKESVKTEHERGSSDGVCSVP